MTQNHQGYFATHQSLANVLSHAFNYGVPSCIMGYGLIKGLKKQSSIEDKKPLVVNFIYQLAMYYFSELALRLLVKENIISEVGGEVLKGFFTAPVYGSAKAMLIPNGAVTDVNIVGLRILSGVIPIVGFASINIFNDYILNSTNQKIQENVTSCWIEGCPIKDTTLISKVAAATLKQFVKNTILYSAEGTALQSFFIPLAGGSSYAISAWVFNQPDTDINIKDLIATKSIAGMYNSLAYAKVFEPTAPSVYQYIVAGLIEGSDVLFQKKGMEYLPEIKEIWYGTENQTDFFMHQNVNSTSGTEL